MTDRLMCSSMDSYRIHGEFSDHDPLIPRHNGGDVVGEIPRHTYCYT